MSREEFCDLFERGNFRFLDEMNTEQIVLFVNNYEQIFKKISPEKLFYFYLYIARKHKLFIEKLPGMLYEKEMNNEKYDRGQTEQFFDNVLESVYSILSIYPKFSSLNTFYSKYSDLKDDQSKYILTLMSEGKTFFEEDLEKSCSGISIEPKYDFSYMYYSYIESELSDLIKDYDEYFKDGNLSQGFIDDIHTLADIIEKK